MPERAYTRAYGSVRFMAPALDPLDVTVRLRLPPDHTHHAGEPRLRRVRRTGRVVESATYAQGMWSMSSRAWVDSPRLAVHVEWLLAELEPKADEVRALLALGVEGDIFCYSLGRTPRAPALPRQLRERAAALGLSIEVDHYDSSPDELECGFVDGPPGTDDVPDA